MRCSLLILLVLAGAAHAEPIRYNLQGKVALGHKPMLELAAAQKVTDIAVELDRDDGKHFAIKYAGLAKGGMVQLPIGDGAAGKASYTGTLSLVSTDGPWSEKLTFDTLVVAPLKVSYDADHLDLGKRVLQFKLSRPADEATLVAIGEDGTELGTGSAKITGEPADKWLSITWTQAAETARVMMIKLRVAAADGAAINLELVPWSVEIAHEDVTFRTDSAAIDPSETKKLDASLAKITDVVKQGERFIKMKLYIAGHTDTVGDAASNRRLSSQRARAIGSYFRKKKLAIPIAVAGFGEDVLKVQTPDNTDQAANRRADYVLGPANGAPPFKGPYAKVKAGWTELR